VEYIKVKYSFKTYRQENPLTSILYHYDKKKKKIVSARDLNKEEGDGAPEENDDHEGDINLLNIIHLIGTQGGRAFGGNQRVFVEDEAYVFNDLNDKPHYGNAYVDNPIGTQNYADYEALMMNRGANVFMNYNQNYFDQQADVGYQHQNTYNQPQYNQQNIPQTNYFNNIMTQFANSPGDHYGVYQNPNAIPINDQVYNPTPAYNPPQPTTDQQFFGNNTQPNQNHYGGPAPDQKPPQNPAYNHYGNNENTGLNAYGIGGGDSPYNPYANNAPVNNYADQNNYENNNPTNYFNNNQYGNRPSGNNPGNNQGDNPYGYGGAYGHGQGRGYGY
jgi:hypothetical protein